MKTVKQFQEAFRGTLKSGGHSNPLSWTSISDGILRVQSQYKDKSTKGFLGKTKERFHRVCESINDHSGVLKILPQEYAGPVCASIEMIVKVRKPAWTNELRTNADFDQASVKHEQVGEDFANALKEIDGVVATTKRGLALYSEDLMLQDLVAQLCCSILGFVAVPLKWYSEGGGKRLRASLNENASKEYEKHIAAIRRLARMIDRVVDLCTAEQSRGTTHILAQENSRLARQNKELQEERLRNRWLADGSQYAFLQQAEDEFNRQLRDSPQTRLLQMSIFIGEPSSTELGRPIKQILDRQAYRFVDDEQAARLAPLQEPSFTSAVTDLQEQDSGVVLHQRVEVEDASGHLNAFFDYDKITPVLASATCFAESEVIQRLQSWTSEPQSSFLGVLGPFSGSQDNAFRLLSSNYVLAAKAANIACVSYFCELPRKPQNPRRLPETIESSAMLCALVRQMVLHLPLQLPEHPALEKRRFEALDGTLRSWDGALSLLSDLVTLAEAPVLLVTVYGLEALEHNATRVHLSALVNTLRQHMLRRDGDQAQKIFKVLFVTSGVSQVLARTLSNAEICDMDRGSAATKPGQARRGRTAVSGLVFND
ncbi:hypothetical protein N0V94_003607 [Neodidymelliopsis sp. IMI 364377]|nr:hypothetical protein N0V94_003607 [Neodidymelliopsis sp. IMI 364377]